MQEQPPDHVQQMVDEMYKKVQSRNYETMFHCFRAKIEQFLKEGYSVMPITDEDRAKAAEIQEMYLALKHKQSQTYQPYSADGEPVSLIRDVLEYREHL